MALQPDGHVLGYLDAYLLNALNPAEGKLVRRHCETCRICQVALEEARNRVAAFHALPPVEASPELLSRTERNIDEYRRQSAFKRLIGKLVTSPHKALQRYPFAAAAVIAILILAPAHAYYATLSPDPHDLLVLGQSTLISGTAASLRCIVFNRDSDSTVADVPVDVEFIGQTGAPPLNLASFRTDSQGTGQPQFRVPEWGEGDYTLRVTAHHRGGDEIVTLPVSLRRAWTITLNTDKPVYQPGQVIHMRGLTQRQLDAVPVSGETADFSVSDSKGNVIFRKGQTTSRFGIAAADCALADEILHGTYTVECRVGTSLNRMSIEVTQYTLPKFNIVAQLDRPYYRPGDVIHGTITANYVFGKALANAEVTIDGQMTAEVPQGSMPSLSRSTDDTGIARFDWPVPVPNAGSSLHDRDAELKLTITVGDSAGERHSITASGIVTQNPIRIEVIPEGGHLVRNVLNRVYLKSTYVDGRPAKTQMVVTGVGPVATDDLGVAVVVVKPSQHTIDWRISALDEHQAKGEQALQLTCGSAFEDFLVRPNKATYMGGEILQLAAWGAGSSSVFVDLIKDGQTIVTDAFPLSNGEGQYSFRLPEELTGIIELHCYRYNARGLVAETSRAIHIQPAKLLEVRTSMDQQQYQPGERAQLKFTLVSSDGQPAPGALSLSVVDRAVDSVLSQSSHTPRFASDEMLSPVLGAYPWSPKNVLSPVQEVQTRFEQALFARTARHNQSEGDATFPLGIRSYEQKLQQLGWRKYSGLRMVNKGWILLVICSTVVVSIKFLLLFLRASTVWTLAAGTLTALVAVALILPATQQAREAARGPRKKVAAMAELSMDERVPENGTAAEPGASIRVRQWFPETLLWKPELITDDEGHATLDVDLADSITTWQLKTTAVTTDGRQGGASSSIRVFQPFFVDVNLPVSLTRGDEIAVPLVVYNYLDQPQTVELRVKEDSWFDPLDDLHLLVETPANGVVSTAFRLRAKRAGRQGLELMAHAGETSDAIRRGVEVIPDGVRVESIVNGDLAKPANLSFTLPASAIEGSSTAKIKIYPSGFSQLVEGLDTIFQQPYGCFEQTSSTTYPNILALDYLRTTGRTNPEVENKAREYIHLGYQRLLGFEVAGGGFDWFGRPPANLLLTAYGLMEFQDMTRVHEIDPRLIERTRTWLLSKRHPDGSWNANEVMLHEDPVRRGDLRQIGTTAYIAWAIYGNGHLQSDADVTREYLLSAKPDQIRDPYTLALICNALWSVAPDHAVSTQCLDRLSSLKHASADGKQVWWEATSDQQTVFYGEGRSRNIETTALAALALMDAKRDPAVSRGALAWLAAQKDRSGLWHTTQATVLTLKALICGSATPLSNGQPRRIQIALDGHALPEVVIPAEESDVVRVVDLSSHSNAGEHVVTVSDPSGQASFFQFAATHYEPHAIPGKDHPALSVDLEYQRTQLTSGEQVGVSATIENHTSSTCPMIVAELPIPAGFSINASDLSAAVAAGQIAKFQLRPRAALIYLRELPPAKPMKLNYHLQANAGGKMVAGPAVAYEYYDPDKRGSSGAVMLEVRPQPVGP